MSGKFDPYHRWLGIPPKHQPPNHYRLLGLEPFEDDLEVIRDAAERQMAHVRRYQLGTYSELSQKILNELGAAKGCLLDPTDRAHYDRQLKEQLAEPEPSPLPSGKRASRDTFDPYRRWLGIPPKHQPPNHYRLLGLEPFEDDLEVIRDAAERQMAHVRGYQLGQHAELSQRILNELGAAKRCLSDPADRIEYDRQLKEWSAELGPPPLPPRRKIFPLIGTLGALLRRADRFLLGMAGRENSRLRILGILAVIAVAAGLLIGVGVLSRHGESSRATALATAQRLEKEAAEKKTQEEERRKKAEDEAARKKVEEETKQKKAEGEAARKKAEAAEKAADTAFETKVRPASYDRGHELMTRAATAMQKEDPDEARRLFEQAAECFAKTQVEAPAANKLGKAHEAWSAAFAAADKDVLVKYASQQFATAKEGAALGENQALAGKLEEAATAYENALVALDKAITTAVALDKAITAASVARNQGQKLRTSQGHSSDVLSVAFSPDGQRVFTGSIDGTAILWDAATGQQLRTFQRDSGSVSSVAFSPDGRQVLTGSWHGMAILWDAATGQQLRTFRRNNRSVSSVTFSPTSVAFSPDGRQVLTGSSVGTAILWDAATGQDVHSFEGHSNHAPSVAFSPDGRQVLTGASGGAAILWDAATGQQIRTFQGHKNGRDVFSVAFSPDGRQVLILTGALDRTAVLWDAATGEKRHTFFFGQSNYLHSVAFSPDGRQVLTGSEDSTAILLDAATGEKLRTFKGHNSAVHSVAFSPDGRQVLTGSHDGTAISVGCGHRPTNPHIPSTGRFNGYRNGGRCGNRPANPHIPWRAGIRSVAFSSDGRQVLTADPPDRAAILWDVTELSPKSAPP